MKKNLLSIYFSLSASHIHVIGLIMNAPCCLCLCMLTGKVQEAFSAQWLKVVANDWLNLLCLKLMNWYQIRSLCIVTRWKHSKNNYMNSSKRYINC